MILIIYRTLNSYYLIFLFIKFLPEFSFRSPPSVPTLCFLLFHLICVPGYGMSLWRNHLRNSRLQELLGLQPNAVVGEVDAVDERAIVILVQDAEDAVELTEDNQDVVIGAVLGGLAAIAVTGSVLYCCVRRYFYKCINFSFRICFTSMSFLVIILYG